MLPLKPRLSALVVWILTFFLITHGAVINIYPLEESGVSSLEPNQVLKSEVLSSAQDETHQNHVYYKFDLSTIPDNVVVSKVSFVAQTKTCGSTHALHLVEKDWSEHSLVFNNRPAPSLKIATQSVGKNCGLHKLEVPLDKTVLDKFMTDKKTSFSISISPEDYGSAMFFKKGNVKQAVVPHLEVEIRQTETSDIALIANGPAEVPQGSVASLITRVFNLGPDSDNTVDLNVDFPVGLSLVNIQGALVDCQSLPCRLPVLEAEGSVDLRVDFQAAFTTPQGPTEVKLEATTTHQDNNPDNNFQFVLFNITEPLNITEECFNFTTCDTCVDNPACGWCADTEECLPVEEFSLVEDCDAFFIETCNRCAVHSLYEEGRMNQAPKPKVSIRYDRKSKKFKFTVDAPYIRDKSSYFIDFVKFEYPKAGYRPTNCENRESRWYQNDPEDFYKQWLSAADAEQPGALNGQFLAYGPSNIWRLTSDTCSAVQYTTAFSMEELIGCSGRDGKPSVRFRYHPETSVAEISGDLFISAVTPVDTYLGPSEGFTVFEYRHPFSFEFNLQVKEISSISTASGITVNPTVSFVGTDANGRLKLSLHTDARNALGHPVELKDPAVISVIPVQMMEFPKMALEHAEMVKERAPSFTITDSRNGLTEKRVSSSQTKKQAWSIVSKRPQSDYMDDITLIWKNKEGDGIAKAKVSLALSSPVQQLGKDLFEAQIQVYKIGQTKTETKASRGPFSLGDQIMIKKELVLDRKDVKKYSLVVENMWVCYPQTLDFTPSWDPERNMHGCAKENGRHMPASNIVQLVRNGKIVKSGIASHFDVSMSTSLTGTTSEVLMKAFPLATQDKTYFVHIESSIIPKGDNGEEVISTVLGTENAFTMISMRGSPKHILSYDKTASVAATVTAQAFTLCMIFVLSLWFM